MSNPCQICGSTDLHLVDGFYYCVECGTQDATVRETVVEQNMLADGTYAQISSKKKFSTVLQDAVQMSGEWHKWHAYNFILAGLTEELIALGAEPTVKMVVLWIWTRYIKKFQQKAEIKATQFEEPSSTSTNEKNVENSSDPNQENSDDTDELNDDYDSIQLNMGKSRKKKKKKKNPDKFRRDIKIVTKGTLLTILYVALNLDKSEIQLTHLFRFIREGRLSLYSCLKFVPKELCVKLIPNWINFIRCQNEYTPRVIRAFAMTIFKRLSLGVPLVPDLNKIISNYIKELCLPNDFKDLVLSLINLMPCNFLQMDLKLLKCHVRIPDYEGACMSYVLVALKMCFGLDCDYELKVSNAVDKINSEEDHLRSFKLGMYSEPTDRLFSFREWYMFLQFRKIILCKYYLPMARQFDIPADDCVFMEHLEERKKRKPKLSDEVTMDILKRIPLNAPAVIPKKEFPATLIPMTSFTEVILGYIQDPDLKLRLCEDFSQYSLEYATKYLKLPGSNDGSENIIQGVDKENKKINPFIIGTLTSKKGDATLVLVRNCENKNWLKTKVPTVKHVTKVKRNLESCEKENGYDSSIERENGYDSSIELIPSECDDSKTETIDEMWREDSEIDNNYDVIDEEIEDVSIFDDDFKNMGIIEDDKKSTTTFIEESYEFGHSNQTSVNLYDSKIDIHDTFSEPSVAAETVFNPHTFNRESVIQELIEIACIKYKIHIPKEKKDREPKKRKIFDNNETLECKIKKKKTDSNKIRRKEAMKITRDLVDAYYENVNNDVLLQITEHVKSIVQSTNIQEQPNAVDNSQWESNLANPSLDNGQSPSSPLPDCVQNETLDSTVEDDNVEDLLPKSNPKFDAETHHIEQLYVKINEEIDIKNIAEIKSDPDIDEIIDKKISEFVSGNVQLEIPVKKKRKIVDSSDSEDDLPLSVLLNEKFPYTPTKNKENFEFLTPNLQVDQYNYWMKHYKSRAYTRSLDMNQKFNIELMENCPISFVFVIRECAAMLNCTTFCLYKYVQTLEERLSSCIQN